jgi:hypothetical protein
MAASCPSSPAPIWFASPSDSAFALIMLLPPLGHTPTLASTSTLRHRSLLSWHSRHATCWRTRVWMTVGCLDAEDVHGGDGRRPWYDCHGADFDRRIDAGAGSICDCQLIGSSGYQNRFVTYIFNY